MHDGWGNKRRWLPWLITSGALLVMLVFWREPISQRLIPDSRLNQQIELAQAALAAGELTRADGKGARELFEAALAIDPEQIMARQGLRQVRDAAMARTLIALKARRATQARQYLSLAEALAAPAVQLQPLQSQLHDLEAASKNIPSLLAQANQPGISNANALALYEQMLILQADNSVALEGRRVLLAQELAYAERLLAKGDIDQAQRLIDAVVKHDPAHLDLPPLLARLGEARATQQQAQLRMLASAQANEHAGRIDAAAETYFRLLAQQPDMTGAHEGLLRCATILAMRAIRQAADFDFRRAEASLVNARRWSPHAPAIKAAEQRIAQARLTQKRLTPAPTRKDLAGLSLLIEQANSALDRGEFIDPPGTSAWDKLRVASALAPQAMSVRQLQNRYRQRTQESFEKALTHNQLKYAQSCLEAHLALDPAAGWVSEASHRLAERWLAYAEERIAASDYGVATAALNAAQRWQPSHPQLPTIRARLRQAQGLRR